MRDVFRKLKAESSERTLKIDSSVDSARSERLPTWLLSKGLVDATRRFFDEVIQHFISVIPLTLKICKRHRECRRQKRQLVTRVMEIYICQPKLTNKDSSWIHKFRNYSVTISTWHFIIPLPYLERVRNCSPNERSFMSIRKFVIEGAERGESGAGEKPPTNLKLLRF